MASRSHTLLLPPPAPIRFDILQNEIREMVNGNIAPDANYRYVEEVEPLLDSLCSQFAIETFRQLTDNGKILTNEVIQSCQINAPNSVPFLEYLIQQAEEDQILIPQDRSWQIHRDSENHATAKDIWNIVIADYPDYFTVINMVGRIGVNLESILNGRQTLLDLLSTNTALAIPIKQVMGTDRRQKIGQVISKLINQGLNELPPGRRLSVMEISQAPPLFAMDICLAMDFDRCDYTFATNSPEVLDEAARLKEHHSELGFRLIGQVPEQEEITPAHLSHLIILTLDFNEISQSLLALNFARSQLSAGGDFVSGRSAPITLDRFCLRRPSWLVSGI